jgi:transmembrane sensor
LELERKKYLLLKYLNNDYQPEELDELLNYVHSLEKEEALDEGLLEIWNIHPVVRLDHQKSDEIWANISSNATDEVRWNRYFSRTALYKVAAVFIGFIVCAYLLTILYDRHIYTKESTSYGKTKELTLPDGSSVYLNSNSSIRYKSNWNADEERIIELDGEAFFKVTHTANHQKFVVKAGKLDVEVLGTEFNVLSRKTRSFVVLKKGKVKLAVAGEKDLIMKPGELVEVSSSQAVRTLVVNPEKYSSWRNNILTFDATPLKEIARVIEENYDLKISIPSKELASERFTGAIPVDENIDVLLTMLSKSYQFEIKKVNDVIVFQKQGH